MAKFNEQGHLVLNKEQVSIQSLVSKLIYVPGDQLAQLLSSMGVNIPRKLRMSILKNVLKASVEKTIEERKTLADEMGYRLTWFSRFTDSQLVNLLEWYKSPDLSNEYLQAFWITFIPFLVEQKVDDKQFNKLLFLANENKGKVVNTKAFNNELEAVMYDNEGEIDGVSIEQFRPVTYKASTLTELRAIGDKFDAPIPKRLRKQEVLEIIFSKLRERKELNSELENKLSNQNILLLERFAKDNDIKVSTELKKEEIIEYILSNAKETKGAYYVPQSSLDYEKQVEEVEESANDIEQVIEVMPVVEEIKVEEPKTEAVEEVKVVRTISNNNDLARIANSVELLVNTLTQNGISINVHIQGLSEESLAGLRTVQNQTVKEEVKLTEAEQQVVTEEYLSIKVAEEAVAKRYHPNRFMIAIAGIFAWLSSLVWAAVAITAAPAFGWDQQLYDLVTFFDLTQIPWLALTIGGGLLAIFNLVVMFSLASRVITRKKLVVFGIISLFTGFVVTGVFALLAALVKGKPVLTLEEQKILEPEKVKQPKKKMTVLRFIKRLIITLIIIAIILLAIIYVFWSLPATAGYDTWELFGVEFGKMIADSIFVPIFGSTHR